MGLESIVSSITLLAMIGKLSCEGDNQVSRAWLAQFMDALNTHDAVAMDFSRTFGAVDTTIADDFAGAAQRDDITGLVADQA